MDLHCSKVRLEGHRLKGQQLPSALDGFVFVVVFVLQRKETSSLADGPRQFHSKWHRKPVRQKTETPASQTVSTRPSSPGDSTGLPDARGSKEKDV